MAELEKKQRETRQKKLVLEIVSKHYDHPDADVVYREVRAIDPKVSKATVYRNLKLLSENGEMRHIKLPGADRYDPMVLPHSHVLCVVCGKVVDAPLPYLDEEDAQVASGTGFAIRQHRTVYEGVCPACQKRKNG